MKRISNGMAVACALALAMGGCAAEVDDKGEEGDAPLDGKLDSFQSPTEHGMLAFDADAQVMLTRGANFHTWEITLRGDAQIAITAGQAKRGVDTVLYLYKEGSSGGFGRYIERNDDVGARDRSSRIETNVSAGRYRVLVKSHSGRQEGPVTVRVGCVSGACVTRPTRELCIFGTDTTFAQAITLRRFAPRETQTYTLAQAAMIDEFDATKIVNAMKAHDASIADVSAALRFAGGTVRRQDLFDIEDRNSYEAYTFDRAGKATGAILYDHSALAVTVTDDRLSACEAVETAPAASCSELTAVSASCHEQAPAVCLESIYEGSGGAGAYAAQCCSESASLPYCGKTLGDLSARPMLTSTIMPLRTVDAARSFTYTGAAPATEAVLRRVHEEYARQFGDACEGLQATWAAEFERVASPRALADKIASDLEELGEYRGLSMADVTAITAYLRSANGITVFTAGAGDENCETSGDLVFVAENGTARVTVFLVGTGS